MESEYLNLVAKDEVKQMYALHSKKKHYETGETQLTNQNGEAVGRLFLEGGLIVNLSTQNKLYI